MLASGSQPTLPASPCKRVMHLGGQHGYTKPGARTLCLHGKYDQPHPRGALTDFGGHSTGRNGPIGPRGQKRPQSGPKCSNPPAVPTGLNPPSVTNDVPIEHLGPWGTQHGAYRGPCEADLNRFATPTPILGALWVDTVIWLYLGPRSSHRNSHGTFPKYHPHFWWFPHFGMVQTHP